MSNRHILTDAELKTLLQGFSTRQNTDSPQSAPTTPNEAKQNSSPSPKPPSESDEVLNNIQTELRQLRSLMSSRIHFSGAAGANASPTKLRLLERLNTLGFPLSGCEKLLDGLVLAPDEEMAWQQIVISLESQLPISQESILEEKGIVAVVGPTGSGKTTLIAKLATKFIQRYNSQDIGLITTDYYSVSGRDQLSTYGSILNIPTQRVNGLSDLNQALENLSDKRLILIDTPGISQRASDFEQKIGFLSLASRPIKNLLTVSATTHELLLDEIIQAFSKHSLSGLCITKTDEAPFLGHLLSACIDHQCPIVATTNGQHVPTDFRFATFENILSTALKALKSPYQSFSQSKQNNENETTNKELTC